VYWHCAFCEGDRLSQSYQEMIAELDVCMGGRAAEEIIFGAKHVTSGASSDLQKATDLARRMVCLYGFSPLLGTVRYTSDDMKYLSPQTKETIDAEVKRILDESYQRAIKCLKDHAGQHENLSQALIKYETLTREQIMCVIEGRTLPTASSGVLL
jgi:ATP-dependent metalloprotease